MKKKSTFKIMGVAAALIVLAGCSEAGSIEAADTVYLTPLQTASVTPQVVLDNPVHVSPEDAAKYLPIVDGFEENAEQLLRRPDVGLRLEQIETVYVLLGRYLDIVAIYQRDVQAHGVESPAAVHLASSLLQLGQRQDARRLLDQILEAQPDMTIALLLDGAYWFQEAETSASAAQKTIASWEKVLKNDPGFRGFKSFHPAMLDHHVERLRARLPTAPSEEPPAEQAAIQHEPLEEVPQEEAAREEAPEEEAPQEEASPEAAPAPEEPVVEQAPVAPPTPNAQILVGQAQLAMARGPDHLEQAQALFRQALQVDPNNLDAAMGLLHIAAQSSAPRDMLHAQVTRIAAHDALTARQAYELGLFAMRTLQDRDLAHQLWRSVKEKDPAYAQRVGVDGLLGGE